MEEDEIVNNVFYLLLKNNYKVKYDYAISKCCTICVPCNNSLRGIAITEEFINDHILQQKPEDIEHFTSWNGDVYQLKENKLILVSSRNYNDNYQASILSLEQSLNNEFRTYKVLALDKPINPSYDCFNEKTEQDIGLDSNICCYKDASKFLNEISKESLLLDLKIELDQTDIRQFNSTEELRKKLRDLSCRYWAKIMRSNSFELQRDARFQSQLSKALEIFAMHCLHQEIRTLLLETLHVEDIFINDKLQEMHRLKVKPDQLGFTETIDMELPSAIVELSHLDWAEGPWEKFSCLHNCLDLMMAEFKGTFADTKMADDEESNIIDTRNINALLSRENLVKLLVYVMVMSRPLKLVTDLHYIRNYIWTTSPSDQFSYILTLYEAAVSVIYKIDLRNLPEGKTEKKEDPGLKDIIELSGKSQVSSVNKNIYNIILRFERMLKESGQIDKKT